MQKCKAYGYTLFVNLHEYNTTSKVLWSLVDTQSNPLNEWKFGQIFYQTNDSYRLFIEEYAGTDVKNYIGEEYF